LSYLSAGALARVSAVADGLLVLSPDGFELESSIGQGISAAMERGIPLLGVVRERWTPAAPPAPDARPLRASGAARGVGGTAGAPRRRTRRVGVVDTLAAGAAGGGAALGLGGAYPTRDSALAARARLWKRGLAARGQGDVLRAPYVLLLGGAVRPDSLRAKGIPAIAWDSGRLVVGAFESPEQAALTEARLRRAGIPATLVTRMGTTP